MALDPLAILEKVPSAARLRVLSLVLPLGIPFNRWLGIKMTEFQPDRVSLESPPRVLRRNHLGGAHACALALMGEMPAGLLISQHYPAKKHRIIIGEMNVKYEKQGRGKLKSSASAPAEWPEIVADGTWVELESIVSNEAGELVAKIHTRWQVKRWEDVRKK